MEIIVNEWLLDYLCPHTDANKTKSVARFLNALLEKCDKIVIRNPSPFIKKFYKYMKQYQSDNECKKRFSRLNQLFFYNYDKTIIVDDRDIGKLPPETEGKIPPKDKYLVELAYFSKDKILVTTDNRLKEILEVAPEIKVHLFEEFINNYLSSSKC